ncbi:peptidylprolyl isomerase [Elusimicrobiota bacterium]
MRNFRIGQFEAKKLVRQYRCILNVGFVLLLVICGCKNKADRQIESDVRSEKTAVNTEGKKMVVTNGSTIKVHYEGQLENGEIFDKSSEEQPLQFVVGSGQIIPGFDNAVEGMQIGEKKEITIEPEDAYGVRSEQLVRDVPRTSLPEDIKLEVGMILKSQSPTGQTIPVVVTGFNEEIVNIDFNHPLAGKKLLFKIEIVDIE